MTEAPFKPVLETPFFFLELDLVLLFEMENNLFRSWAVFLGFVRMGWGGGCMRHVGIKDCCWCCCS